MEQLSPQNISAAAVLAQLLILLIMVIGSLIMGRLSPRYVSVLSTEPRSNSFSLLFLVLALVSFGAFFISDVFMELWRPLFGKNDFPSITWSAALGVLFVLDIFVITVLVVSTGGPQTSPFAALFTLVPVVALFLRESTLWVVIYSSCAMAGFSVSFSANMKLPDRYGETQPNLLAFWFVNISSIALATYIGLVTRS